jgi:glycosyltransferase involved in cell wall biosynthesis
MRALVVSGIWPPDPGGPATHAPALADFLLAHGHGVEVVTTADEEPEPRDYPVQWVSRGLPTEMRYARCVRLVRACARSAHVVYATSMIRRAAAGAALARRPLVVKLVSDEAFERMQREGRYAGTLDEFQHERGSRVRFLRSTFTRALGRAEHVFSPSEYLRGLALGWGIDPERISVLPNPAPDVPELPPREELRREFGLEGLTLAFAGRLGPPKALWVALEALAAAPEASLVIAGDGPEREHLERQVAELGLDGRVRFLGNLTRDGVLRLFRAADAVVLSSSWENLPHTVLEALAVGTPVIATAVGGVPEVVSDGMNGLLVPPREPQALAAAIHRFLDDAALRVRLAEAATGSVAAYTEESVFARIEDELVRAARR